MFSRIQFKENAKQLLRRYYWMAFAVCTIYTIISGIGTSTITGKITVNFQDEITYFRLGGWDLLHASWEVLLFLFGSLFVLIFSLGLTVFLINPVMAGRNRYFMLSRTYRCDLGSLFSSFSSGRYLNIVKTLFFRGLFIWLWSLLFIVPGIIKSYQYRMVPYILAENPDMDWRRALNISRAMTQGHKWDLFILDLSFYGWLFLGALLCGVGILFVLPYIQATNAEVYEFMRQKAFATGICSYRELPGFYPRTDGMHL